MKPLEPSDECMQKDALRHKVPELSRGFPWEKTAAVRWLVVFLGQLQVLPWETISTTAFTSLVENLQSIPNLGNHHHICWMNLNHANLLGIWAEVLTGRPYFLGFLAQVPPRYV